MAYRSCNQEHSTQHAGNSTGWRNKNNNFNTVLPSRIKNTRSQSISQQSLLLYIHREGEDYSIWSVSGTSGRAESFPTTELYIQCLPHWVGTYHVAEDELELLIFPSHTRSIGSTKITLHLVMWCRGLNSGLLACQASTQQLSYILSAQHDS